MSKAGQTEGEESPRRKYRGHNEGSICQRANGRWVGAISLEDGKRKVYYGKTRAEVARKVNKGLQDLEQGISPADDRITVGAYLDKWLEHTVKPNRRYSTYRGYEQNVRLYLKPELGKIRLSKLSADDVEDLTRKMIDRGLSQRTAQYAHAVLRVALKKAVRHNTISRNVASLVDAPTVDREKVTPLTTEEARIFFRAVQGDSLEALYTITLALGFRLGEVCGLKWGDVDLDKKRVWIRRALQRQKGAGLVEVEPKSRSSRRALPLPPFVAQSLKAHRARQAEHQLSMGAKWTGPTKEEGWVFTMENGRPVAPDYVQKCFPTMLKTAKIRHCRFHDLRHSCASFLFSKGCELRLVQEILGHSQIQLTADTYTHLLPEGDRRAAKAMQSLFG